MRETCASSMTILDSEITINDHTIVPLCLGMAERLEFGHCPSKYTTLPCCSREAGGDVPRLNHPESVVSVTSRFILYYADKAFPIIFSNDARRVAHCLFLDRDQSMSRVSHARAWGFVRMSQPTLLKVFFSHPPLGLGPMLACKRSDTILAALCHTILRHHRPVRQGAAAHVATRYRHAV